MKDIKDWSIPTELDGMDNLSEKQKASYIHAIKCQKTLETLLSVTDDFIYIKDINHKFIYASKAFAQLTNHNSWKDLIGKDDFDIFPKEHAKVYFEYEQAVIQKGQTLRKHEEPYYNQEGKLCWVTSTKNPVYDEEGNVIGLVGISKDITDLKEQKDQIHYLASHDELTGLSNRRAFFSLGDKMVSQAIRNRQQISLLYIDLDNFKQVNDHLGHAQGDKVLNFFASHIKECCREADLVARIGGDEFAILISSDLTGQYSAIALANRISSIYGDDRLHRCECSIGIAFATEHFDLLSLLKIADNAMYNAKRETEMSYCLAQ